MKKLIPAALAACLALPAAAQECGPREDVQRVLSEQYGEAPQSGGLDPSGGGIVVMWANAQTGTWSLVVERPDGAACLIIHGEAWRRLDMPAGTEG